MENVFCRIFRVRIATTYVIQVKWPEGNVRAARNRSTLHNWIPEYEGVSKRSLPDIEMVPGVTNGIIFLKLGSSESSEPTDNCHQPSVSVTVVCDCCSQVRLG